MMTVDLIDLRSVQFRGSSITVTVFPEFMGSRQSRYILFSVTAADPLLLS
jgi:hypothetical protein